ncbi:serine hydrolase family protein [Candidatus Daviesbacteria bacterium]|nr:serine hydrolase family protein [Candidatus Daviesbacteria bacterium]
MNKRVVIVHCWDGYPEYCWYPQTKKELEEKNFEVIIPQMPETNLPRLSLWLPKLREVIGQTDEDLSLVGHSSGCITILRYLETLEDNQRVDKVILVAGFTDDLGYEELKNFFEKPIDFEKIRKKANKFIAIHSDNDPFVSLKYGDIFKDQLGAKLIVKHQMGHFSGPVDETESITNLEEVSQEIVKET